MPTCPGWSQCLTMYFLSKSRLWAAALDARPLAKPVAALDCVFEAVIEISSVYPSGPLPLK